MTYLYVQSEEQLWTVGSGEPGSNSWRPESDHGSDDDAARRVAWLNGSPAAGPLSDGERQQLRALLFGLNLTVGQVDQAVDAIAGILGRAASSTDEAAEVDTCERCPTPTQGVCCSSHGKRLCHRCYRLTHFVEVCVEGCTACQAEGLPVVMS